MHAHQTCFLTILVLCLEVALGGKPGESRSLVDGPDKEEKMKLPTPPPLGIFGPLYSVGHRDIMHFLFTFLNCVGDYHYTCMFLLYINCR